MATAWTRVRRLIWSWYPWAALSVYLVSLHAWWWAAGAGQFEELERAASDFLRDDESF